MNRQEILKKLNSAILCLMAHPDNEPDSEFADRVEDLIEIRTELSNTNQAKEQCQCPMDEADSIYVKAKKCYCSYCDKPIK